MHKKILRILSLALAILLLVSVFPQKTSANAMEISEIRKQITSTYKAAKRLSGHGSFSGYCASLVNWQLLLLGITKEKVTNNGNQEYDYFEKMDYTSGGYRVHAYPATRYDLEGVLNFLTKDGTKDVYNMIVCFQKTRSAAGQRYGHAFMIHAILDGIVYYSESSSLIVGGKYFAEGSAISCSIEDFCAYYETWVDYEGLIHFGQKTYADECDYYPSNLYATVQEGTNLYSSPCTTETDDRSKLKSELKAGERVHVVGVYLNSENEYWYELNDGHQGYIPADAVQIINLDYSDVIAVGTTGPSVLRVGNRFNLTGQIQSDSNLLHTVRAQVYRVEDGVTTQVYSTTATVDGHDYNLNGSSLSNNLAFRKLSKGTYLYKLAAVVGNYYYAGGTLQLEWKTIELYTAQFEVVSSRNGHVGVTFDPNGGQIELNQMDIPTGTNIGSMPIPTRQGYTFVGWYLADEPGRMVGGSTTFDKSVTLCARWAIDTQASGWYVSNGTWYYLSQGVPQQGFVTDGELTYYLDSQGVPVTGWKNLGGNTYYFNNSGVMQTGMTYIGGVRSYLGEDGVLRTGWVQIGENLCYLSDTGALSFGWVTIGNSDYFFDADTGNLIMIRNNLANNYFFMYN